MPLSGSPCAISNMWGKWPCEPPAWPVAPRPFAIEPIGGWVGRVAARYRMSVDELAQEYGLQVDFDRPSNAWLLILRVSEATIGQLAALARVKAADLSALQLPQAESATQTQLAYCQGCIFLNPQDVTSPCWKREWMDPSVAWCTIHDRPLQRLPIASLRICGNFDHVLRLVSRREAHRRKRDRQSVHPH